MLLLGALTGKCLFTSAERNPLSAAAAAACFSLHVLYAVGVSRLQSRLHWPAVMFFGMSKRLQCMN